MTERQFRIVLEDRLLPVQAYFNALPDDIFLRALENLAAGMGADYNGVGYVLPWEDDDSAPESGVLFYIPHEEVSISNAEMLQHLVRAVDAYVASHPQHRDAADSLVVRVVKKYPV